MRLYCFVFAILITLVVSHQARADVILGPYDFDSSLFGNTLTESDGGTFSAGNWLNIANADPGNPGYLTGANFDTGIANIGFSGGPPIYTIGYNTPIVNSPGDDLGVVVARFSTDNVTIAFSTDGGANFTANFTLASGSAVSTGVGKNYFYGGGGPFNSTLFVHALDLSNFGFGNGANVNAIRVTVGPNSNQLDLIRVAGFDNQVIPEPTSFVIFGMLTIGAAGYVGLRRRKKITQ